MKTTPAERDGRPPPSHVSGRARLGRRTSSLLRRVRPGEIAVIDHVDLDQASAQALVDAEVAAVVNVSPSTSGRYPNRGPQVIVDAGIPLVDATEGQVFTRLHDGDQVRIEAGAVYHDQEHVGSGTVLDQERVAEAAESARSGMSTQLETFSANATEFLRREADLLLEGAGVPAVRTRFEGRPVVVVAKAYDYEDDLLRLRSFIREQRPLLVGVDGGADALVAAGHRPDVIVGDLDTVGDDALRGGGEVVARVSHDGTPPLARLERLGLTCTVFRTSVTSEDAALLLADSGGARLVVTAGSHTGLEQYLDRGRSAMASSFLTRLRVAPTLVDARAVHGVYRSPVRTWQLLLLALAGLLAVALAVAATPVGEQWWRAVGEAVAEPWAQVRGWWT